MRGRVWLVAVSAATGVACAGPAGAMAAPCGTGSHTFTAPASPAEQCYTVPAGVTKVAVEAIGAKGGTDCGAPQGKGADVSADLPVTSGETLYVEVGTEGGSVPNCGTGPGGAGGFNGGGGGGSGDPTAAGVSGGGGGGASDVRTISSTADTQISLGSRLIVAGGGGGAGAKSAYAGGGDAGRPGTAFRNGQVGLGGGAGTPVAPGAGGQPCDPAAGVPGLPGSFGLGGAGASSNVGLFGGGGGGGGWYGGGGSQTTTSLAGCIDNGGGGGGGSSYVTPAATNATVPTATTATPSVTITPLVPTASVSGAIAFGATQPQSTVSAAQTVTVSNAADASGSLHVTSTAITGADSGDFLIGAGCQGAIAPGASCRFSVYFAPQAIGARTATLEIGTDDPANATLSVTLSGTGGSLPQGAVGPAGGQGPAGEIELVTCRTVTKKIHLKHHKIRKKKVKKCTTKTITGSATFTAAHR